MVLEVLSIFDCSDFKLMPLGIQKVLLPKKIDKLLQMGVVIPIAKLDLIILNKNRGENKTTDKYLRLYSHSVMESNLQ